MPYNIESAKRTIRNKWDWENPFNNYPVFIHGSIGIGKTQMMQELVAERMIFELKKKLPTLDGQEKLIAQNELVRLTSYKDVRQVIDLVDRHLLTLRVSSLLIENITGIPAPSGDKSSCKFLIPENMLEKSKQDWLVIFLDELDKGSAVKLTALTFLIESKRVGEFYFPNDTMIVAAANRITDSFLSKAISPELKNRAANIDVVVDIDIWCAWALRSEIKKAVVDFVQFKKRQNKNILAVYSEEVQAGLTNEFPTPRSWAYGANQMDRMERQGMPFDEQVQELSQYVGTDAANEYKIYVLMYNTVDINKILDGTDTIPGIQGSNFADTIAKQHVYVFAIANQLTVEHLNDTNSQINLAKALSNLSSDMCVAFLMTLVLDDTIFNAFVDSPHLAEFVNKYFEIIQRLQGKK